MRDEALISYRHQVLCWSVMAAWSSKGTKPPAMPKILKNEARRVHS